MPRPQLILSEKLKGCMPLDVCEERASHNPQVVCLPVCELPSCVTFTNRRPPQQRSEQHRRRRSHGASTCAISRPWRTPTAEALPHCDAQAVQQSMGQVKARSDPNFCSFKSCRWHRAPRKMWKTRETNRNNMRPGRTVPTCTAKHRDRQKQKRQSALKSPEVERRERAQTAQSVIRLAENAPKEPRPHERRQYRCTVRATAAPGKPVEAVRAGYLGSHGWNMMPRDVVLALHCAMRSVDAALAASRAAVCLRWSRWICSHCLAGAP